MERARERESERPLAEGRDDESVSVRDVGRRRYGPWVRGGTQTTRLADRRFLRQAQKQIVVCRAPVKNAPVVRRCYDVKLKRGDYSFKSQELLTLTGQTERFIYLCDLFTCAGEGRGGLEIEGPLKKKL